jgi:hypothetical protein
MSVDLEVIRAKLQKRHPCDPKCPGWAVFETGDCTLEIEVCNDCFFGVENPPMDEDVAQLPEAQYALGVDVGVRHAQEHIEGRWDFCPLCKKEKCDVRSI